MKRNDGLRTVKKTVKKEDFHVARFDSASFGLRLLLSALIVALVVIPVIALAVSQAEVDNLKGRLVNIRDRSLADAITEAKSKERLDTIAESAAYSAAIKTNPGLKEMLESKMKSDIEDTEVEAAKTPLEKAAPYGIGLGIAAVVLGGLFLGYKKGIFSKIAGNDAESSLIELLKRLIGIKEEVKKDSSFIYTHLTAERGTFDECRVLIGEITEHIKETIGEEKELVDEIEKSKHINSKLSALRDHNNAERNAAQKALTHLNEGITDIERIRVEEKKLFEDMNKLKGIDKAFDRADEGLRMLGEVDVAEVGVIDRIQAHFKETVDDFQMLEVACENIHQSLHGEIEELIRLEKGEPDYQAILLDIRRLRDNAIRLNRLFAQKVKTFKDIADKLQELEVDMSDIHSKEVEKLKDFLKLAKDELVKDVNAADPLDRPSFERVVFYAKIVSKNAAHLGEEQLAKDAKRLVDENLPKLVDARKAGIDRSIIEIESLLSQGGDANFRQAFRHLQRVLISEVDIKHDVGSADVISKVKDVRDKTVEKLLEHAKLKSESNDVNQVESAKMIANLVEQVSKVKGHSIKQEHKRIVEKIRAAKVVTKVVNTAGGSNVGDGSGGAGNSGSGNAGNSGSGSGGKISGGSGSSSNVP
jgi:hypothetical protein